jgi:4-hydroxy-4-methyl-2-oxoglutarate aldolase
VPQIINKLTNRPAKDIVDQFGKLSTPNISDACERNKIRATCDGIIPMVSGAKMAGPALTVNYVPLDPASLGTREDIGEYMFDLAQPGDVVVIDNSGVTSYTCWGDILTFASVKLGLAGTVIDGVFRDYDNILKMKYPIFSRGRTCTTGKDRLELQAVNTPVNVGGILVRPGDIIVGDDTAVLRVPFERADKVLEDAKGVEAAENRIIEAVKSGLNLKQAREQNKYYELQRVKSQV